MLRKANPPCSPDDCYQEMMIAAVEASRRYDSSLAKWSTYCYTKMKWAMRRYLVYLSCEKRFRLSESVPIDESMLCSPAPSTPQEDVGDVVEDFLGRLDPQSSWVLRSYYGIGCEKRTLRNIAEVLGISRQAVQQQRLRAEGKLRRIAIQEENP